jgi:REP element-mobilizing transposase RayT/DNA-binding transcriptional regulator YiaG
MKGSQVQKPKRVRIQEGSIHVYFRGNQRNNVFYTDRDKIMFLKLCNKFAKEYLTIVQGFVIMDNHVHLQVQTKCLTDFMKSLLRTFSRWYNKEYLTRGKVFSTPFNSSCKYTNTWIADSLLYILQNPISAKICQHPEEYQWSSYHFHYQQKNPLKKFIEVDTTLLENAYCSKYLLDKAIMEKQIEIAEIKEEQNRGWERISNGEIARYIKSHISKEDSIYSLSTSELRHLALSIRKNLHASYLQIASILHVSKKQVEKWVQEE